MGWRVGVDIGGTFTDVALIEEETGRIAIAKVPTTSQDFADGVTAGLRQGLERHGIEPTAVSLLSHATTVVTNALLEKRAPTGFCDDARVSRRARPHCSWAGLPQLPNPHAHAFVRSGFRRSGLLLARSSGATI